jgi:hypothetical protein
MPKESEDTEQLIKPFRKSDPQNGPKETNIQGVSRIHGITSGMGSSYVDNKNSLYQPRSGNA